MSEWGVSVFSGAFVGPRAAGPMLRRFGVLGPRALLVCLPAWFLSAALSGLGLEERGRSCCGLCWMGVGFPRRGWGVGSVGVGRGSAWGVRLQGSMEGGLKERGFRRWGFMSLVWGNNTVV